jgi:tetratricopeptide (TPR) repeat protein
MKESATAAPAALSEPRSVPPRGFDRAEGLSESGRRLLTEIALYAKQRRPDAAEKLLPALMALSPTHPETLRMRAAIAHLRNRHGEAAVLLRRVVEERPFDALPWNNLGAALAELKDVEGSVVAFRKCAELAPERAAPWFNLGHALDILGRVDEAHDALVEALKRDPEHIAARVTLARVLQFMGRIDEASSEYRKVVERNPESALAWYGLSTVLTARFTPEDAAAIERVYSRPNLSIDERIAAGFALARALEDQGRYSEGFAVLTAANSMKRRQLNWDARVLSRYIDSIADAYAHPTPSAAPPEQGREVIFIFGLPRSGSTLVEQILAAHPQVTGANELDDLSKLMQEESLRRGAPFPAWIRQATPEDWKRLGEQYLERTAKWRATTPIHADKGLSNWGYVGALRAMLPGAKLVNCRRDPVENCLACFRQSFAQELGFTYDLAEVASYWRDYDRLTRIWQARYPGAVRDVVHEELTAEPDAEIRALLDFCGLPFDEACLNFHEAERNVRTASAAQVREPIRKSTARADRYGALLDPLRAMLAKDAAAP